MKRILLLPLRAALFPVALVVFAFLAILMLGVMTIARVVFGLGDFLFEEG